MHGTLEGGRVELVVADKHELGVLGQNSCRDLPLVVVRGYVQQRVARDISRVLCGRDHEPFAFSPVRCIQASDTCTSSMRLGALKARSEGGAIT